MKKSEILIFIMNRNYIFLLIIVLAPTSYLRVIKDFLTTSKYENLAYVLPDLFSPKKNCSFCPDVYIPVCTTLNRTFKNVCYFNCANFSSASVTYLGNCIDF